MYDKKLQEYKQKQAEIIEKMSKHSDADKEFYLTAKTIFELGRDAKEPFNRIIATKGLPIVLATPVQTQKRQPPEGL